METGVKRLAAIKRARDPLLRKLRRYLLRPDPRNR
jgi:hypothetical protein